MKKLLGSLFSLALLSSGHAQFAATADFFGGYADGVTSLPTGKNVIGPALRMVYDDFTFDLAGDITDFGMIGRNNTGSPVAIYWEIRSGVSAGNGGTLIYSGTSPSALFSALPSGGSLGTAPAGAGQYGLYQGGLPTGTFLHLEPGTYWLGLAPLEQFGSFDVASTQGLSSKGHPIDNGNAFYYDSSSPSANFISMGANDFGLGFNTLAPTSVVPEPGTLSLLGLAALGLFRWQTRR